MTRVQFNRLAKICVTVMATLLVMGIAGQSFGQVTNTNVYAPANYTTFQPPSKGGSYTDAVFGTAIKRLSDSMNMTRADIGSGTVGTIGSEYSTMSPFNMDNSRLILQHFAYYGLYDGAGNYLHDLPFNVSASTEPRWSRQDPGILYYVVGNQLKQINVGSNVITVVHTFSEYSSITGAGESDISVDGNHFVFAGDHRYVFVYDIANGTKTAVFDTAGHSFDSLYISPSNQVTITWLSSGSSRYQGIELFDANMNFLRQLTKSGGHMDIAQDTNGDEVLLWTNSNDPTPIACNNGIVKVRLSDAKQTCLVQLDWSLAVHVSAPDNNGWVFVETYSPGDIIPPTGWKAYTDEFLQVKLDGTEVRRLAHHRSRPLNSYTYMPKISTSHDGTKIVFGSNFGLQAQIGNPAEYSDAYMIDLGPSVPPAPAPAPTPTGALFHVEETAAAMTFSGNWMANNNGVQSGGRATLAMDAGSKVSFTFTGSAISWIAYRDMWSGIARVSIDGVVKGDIDTYSPLDSARAQAYSVSDLAWRAHTITIEVLGTHSSSSYSSWVWVDAFDYTGLALP